MRKVIDCFKEDNPIINKKLREVSVEEGNIIATELFQILNKRGDGIGLAANQVGIDAQVAVVNVIKPLVLINPKIEEQWDEIDYYEGCLSYPKHGIHTKRYKNILLKLNNQKVNGILVEQKLHKRQEEVGKKRIKKMNKTKEY